MNLKRNTLFLGGLFALVATSVITTGNAVNSQSRPTVQIDGSSTVYPVTEAVAEEFQNAKQGSILVTVGVSGTGGGFKKFCSGEESVQTDISNASRPIKDEEIEACKAAGIEFIELPIAYDALTVVVNPENPVNSMTVDELRTIWEKAGEGTITKWNQVNPSWPDAPLVLYGPGADSGTFDYFVEAVLGKDNDIRTDFTPSEDDNVLVQGVVRDPSALGYFGFAYYEENQDQLKAIAIDPGDGNPVLPSAETVNNGTYTPLSRPIYIYVNKASLDKPEVKEFVEFYLQNAPMLVGEVGYVPLPDEDYQKATERFQNVETGRVPLREGL